MKNKLLMILLCGVMVLGFATGCGNEKKNNSPSDNQSNVQDSKKETLEIKKYLTKFKDGLAVVEASNGSTFVIDETGDSKFEVDSKYNNFTVSNGYVVMSVTQKNVTNEPSESAIFDKTGKKVAENKGYISQVSENGYYIVRKKDEKKYTIEDIKGNVIYTENTDSDSTYHYYIEKDIFRFNAFADNEKFIDAKTGKELTDYKLNNIPTSAKKLNDKYYYDNNSIYDMSNNKVKDLIDVESIYEINNVIYVENKSNELYTLDNSFNYIVEPKKDGWKKLLGKSSLGIVIKDISNKKTYVANEKLELQKELSIDGVIQDIDGKFIYIQDEKIFNIETNSIVQIYK